MRKELLKIIKNIEKKKSFIYICAVLVILLDVGIGLWVIKNRPYISVVYKSEGLDSYELLETDETKTSICAVYCDDPNIYVNDRPVIITPNIS